MALKMGVTLATLALMPRLWIRMKIKDDEVKTEAVKFTKEVKVISIREPFTRHQKDIKKSSD